ncbi:unnamed protein product [Cercospora beticola]|nr:unnamed protein product [Cercospora beticola]
MVDTNSVMRDENDQQVLLAALFGVLTTVLAVASVVVAYLQLRKYRWANAVQDIESNDNGMSLGGIQPHDIPSSTADPEASEHQVDASNVAAPKPSGGEV